MLKGKENTGNPIPCQSGAYNSSLRDKTKLQKCELAIKLAVSRSDPKGYRIIREDVTPTDWLACPGAIRVS